MKKLFSLVLLGVAAFLFLNPDAAKSSISMLSGNAFFSETKAQIEGVASEIQEKKEIVDTSVEKVSESVSQVKEAVVDAKNAFDQFQTALESISETIDSFKNVF